MEETKCVDLDYKREYEILLLQNHQLREELEKYKQALLNISLKT